MKTFKKPEFEYILCERKNGTKFIKIVQYIYDADGYIEVARINQTKSNWIEQGSNDIETVFEELKYNMQAVENRSKQLINL